MRSRLEPQANQLKLDHILTHTTVRGCHLKQTYHVTLPKRVTMAIDSFFEVTHPTRGRGPHIHHFAKKYGTC